MRNLFHIFSARVSNAVGSPYAFLLALLVIVIWATTGPLFSFSDTWQLVINTGTTIITFLMVFLIQNTQNRDSKALHLKLDELIRTQVGARDSFTELENLSDDELMALDKDFQMLHSKHAVTLTSVLTTKLHEEKKRRTFSGNMKHVIEGVKNFPNRS